MSSQVLVLRYAKFKATGIQERIEGSMHNTLRSDIHPTARRHLSVVGNAEFFRNFPILKVVEHADHQCVCDDNAGRGGL